MLWGIVALNKRISWENIGWVVGSRVGSEVYMASGEYGALQHEIEVYHGKM